MPRAYPNVLLELLHLWVFKMLVDYNNWGGHARITLAEKWIWGSEYSGKKTGFLHKAREITTDPVSLQVLEECLHSSSKKCTSQSEESSHHWDRNGVCLCRPGSMTRQGTVELGSLVSAKVIRFQNTSKKWWPLTIRNKVGIITVMGNKTRMTNSGPWPM